MEVPEICHRPTDWTNQMSTYLQLQFVVSTFMSVYTAQQCSVTDYCEIQELYITFFKHNQKVLGTNITAKLCSLSWTDNYLHSCPKCRQNYKHGNINTTYDNYNPKQHSALHARQTCNDACDWLSSRRPPPLSSVPRGRLLLPLGWCMTPVIGHLADVFFLFFVNL